MGVYKNNNGVLSPIATGVSKNAQVTILPTASASNVGEIFQYIGSTTASYTNGYFYRCVQSGANYLWTNIDVQTGGGASSDNVVEGYFNSTDNLFYEESTYTTPIIGANNVIYISLDTDLLYRYNGSIFIRVDEVDISNKADKVTSATNGDLASLNSNGNLVDSGIASSNVVVKSATVGLIKNDGTIDTNTYLTDDDIADKADKVDNATNGDLAGLDANGNLTDSGVLASNVVTKVSSATNGDLAGLNASGELTDSGILASNVIVKSATTGLIKNDGTIDESDYLTSADIADKADIVENATADDFATLDASGNLTDSGINKNIVPSNASSSNKLATQSDVASAYRPSGNATLATLPALTEANLNRVYNMTEDFVTTADFAEGAGVAVKAGNEVGIIDISSTSTPDIKYTVLGGFIDLSDYIQKSQTSGLVKNDGSIDTSSYATTTQLAGKADKVANASNGHLAGLDANGNLTDSGVLATSISGKADKVVSATDGDLAKLNSYGNLVDSGISANNVVVKSSTAGLIKNDGSIDETSYATTAKAYLTDDTAETALADADYVPFYDTSATAKRKSTWANIKSVLKTYFDTIYSTIKTLNGLTDTNITSPSQGQILEYDAVNEKWVNAENIQDFARYGGAKTFAELTSSLLVAENVDKFYLCTDGGTISSADASNWLLPVGSVIPPDSHIAVIEFSTGVYKFDDFGGYVDISGKADRTELAPLYSTADTAETTLADNDYFPFYDTSATGKRKTLWSNVKSVLKTYFDTIYSTVKTLSGLDDTNISATPTDGQVLTYDGTNDEWINATPSGGGHIMTPTPNASLTRADLQTAVASAVTEGGINDDVVSAWAIGNWSNTMTNRVIYSGTIAVGDTGIGTWLTDAQLAALRAETDPVAREALEVGTGGYGWWKDSHFLGLDAYNDYEIKIKYKLQNTDEVITLGGFILDTDTGCLCIKFGGAIQNAGNVVAVDITITQNNISSSGGA